MMLMQGTPMVHALAAPPPLPLHPPSRHTPTASPPLKPKRVSLPLSRPKPHQSPKPRKHSLQLAAAQLGWRCKLPDDVGRLSNHQPQAADSHDVARHLNRGAGHRLAAH